MPFTETQPGDERVGPREGRVLIVCGDLFFGTQVASVVREAGLDPLPEMLAERTLGHLADSAVIAVLLDLETRGVDPAALLASLPASRPRVVAFGPHVQTQRLEAARAAGCDAVLSRGQVTSSASLLRRVLLGEDEPSSSPETEDA
ncbi:MAG: hypothetical protein KF774_16985 [Planctomyces sp.]|nr:hypothetical protein [Planctomyces sp.]